MSPINSMRSRNVFKKNVKDLAEPSKKNIGFSVNLQRAALSFNFGIFR